MLKPTGLALLAAATALPLALAPPTLEAQSDESRLYGRVTLVDGVTYEGYIRWGANEAGWHDILSVSKRLPERNRAEARELGWEPDERRRRIEIFGIGITLPGDRSGDMAMTAQAGVRFGHIGTIEPLTGSRARVILKSGQEIEFTGGGDLGTSLGRIRVGDPRGGDVELEWRRIRSIDFMPPPAGPPAWGERLYGTLRTRDGDTFTGYVAWDMDEIFTSDVLDGREDGHSHEIPFSRISGIERHSASASLVRLSDGRELLLRGSNDVNSSNRDIMIADPALGEVRVKWSAFDRLDFRTPPAAAPYAAYDGGRPIRGTVTAHGGQQHTGTVRWDNDEEHSWEILDGRLTDGVDLDIEFASIAVIERATYRTSRVVLRDGRAFELGHGNDVDETNKGLYIRRDAGGLVLVRWEDFQRLEIEQ